LIAQRKTCACEVLVLSLEKTRKLLGPECPMNDKELTALLNQLSQIAAIALDAIACEPTYTGRMRDPGGRPQ